MLASSRRAWSSVSAGVLPRRTTCFGVASEMGTGYATLWNTFKRITAGCSHTEKLALYSGTAVACGFTPRSVRGVAAGAGTGSSNPSPSSGESGAKGFPHERSDPGAVSRRDNAAMGPNSASPSPQPRSDSYGLARRDARGLFARLFLRG